MECRYCGTNNETVKIRFSKGHRAICSLCNRDTPRKVDRESFDQAYWGAKHADVPNGIKREFYSDYLGSVCTLTQYKEETTTAA